MWRKWAQASHDRCLIYGSNDFSVSVQMRTGAQQPATSAKFLVQKPQARKIRAGTTNRGNSSFFQVERKQQNSQGNLKYSQYGQLMCKFLRS